MRKLTLSLAVLTAILPFSVYPLGLGEIELDSALNQDLDARIRIISASAEDADSLIVKLAGREAFSRVGLDRPFGLQQLKFKVINKNGQLFIQVFTKSPVQEPYLSFLVEIDWPKGHLLREYTLLLDPPVYNSGASSSGSSRPFDEPADSQAQYQSASEQDAFQSGAQTGAIPPSTGYNANTQYQPAPQANASAVNQYRVQKNDTLWRIAERMRPDSGVSIEQMMLALLRQNPEAFIRDNINGVKRGYILRAPSRDEITRVDRQRAVSLAREHTALWREYSRGVTSGSPASSMAADAPGGTATDQPRAVDGHLSIVGAGESSDEFAGSNQDANAELELLRQDLAMAREELESAKLEKQNLRTRLAELEQQVQSAIQMDDAGLAQLQNDMQGSQQPEEEITSQKLAEDVMTEEEIVPEDGLLGEEISEEVAPEEIEEMSGEEALADEELPEGVSEEKLSGEELQEEDVFVDETDKDVIDVDEPAGLESTPVESVVDTEAPAFAQKKPEGFLENLMNDPKLQGIIGGSLAFVFLLVALLLKRMRGGKSDENEWSADADSEEEFNLGVIEDTGDDPTRIKPVQDMETTAEMMVDTMKGIGPESTGPLGLEDTHVDESDDDDTVFGIEGERESAEDEEEMDDVLSEAGVYISYGIFHQVEELLLGALEKDPGRDDYRLKLLEAYYASKNAPAFEQLAQEVHERKGDDKSYWDRVVAMGMEVCPESSLFSGAGTVLSDFDAEALLPETHVPADLDLEAETEPAGEGSVVDELDLEGDLENITESIASGTAVEADTDAGTAIEEELEFDLGELDEDLGSSGEELLETDASDIDIDDDFSLDFDASDLGFEEPEEGGVTEIDVGLGGMDDALSEDTSLDEVSEELDLTADLDLDDLDLGSAELDSTGVDVSDLDVSVDNEIPAAEPVANIDVGSVAIDDDFDISELSEDIDEISTKLDLARAYIDMGDSEGARSILEEVKAEGTGEQQKEADALLQKAS